MSKAAAPSAVSLNILGKEYKIACAEDEQAALIQSAQMLDLQMRKIRDTGKVSGADRIAVLAALNLAHDLSANNIPSKSIADAPAELSTRLIDMRLKIEKVLEAL